MSSSALGSIMCFRGLGCYGAENILGGSYACYPDLLLSADYLDGYNTAIYLASGQIVYLKNARSRYAFSVAVSGV